MELELCFRENMKYYQYLLNFSYYRGSLDIKMAPKALTQREESELQAMLDRLALENEEVNFNG